MITRLFENLLQEAEKSRFIKKMWSDAGCDEPSNWHAYSLEDTIDFFNKHQNIKVEWQSKATNVKTLWDIMDNYNKEKSEKDFKNNPSALFKDKSKFKIVKETNNWIFVSPLNWEAAIEVDSFSVGGAGAKWCIGYKNSSYYWDKYVTAGDIFVLAYNKDPEAYGSEENLKYMIDFYRGYSNEVTTWRQSDDPDNTLEYDETCNLVGIDVAELCESIKDFWRQNVKVNGYKEVPVKEILENNIEWEAVAGDAVYLYDIPEVFEYGRLLSLCKNVQDIEKCEIAGSDSYAAKHGEIKHIEDDLLVSTVIIGKKGKYEKLKDMPRGYPKLMFNGCGNFICGTFYVDDNFISHNVHPVVFRGTKVKISTFEIFLGAHQTTYVQANWNANKVFNCIGDENDLQIKNYKINSFGGLQSYADSDWEGNLCLTPTGDARDDKCISLRPGQKITVDYTNVVSVPSVNLEDIVYIADFDENDPYASPEDANELRAISIYNLNTRHLSIPYKLYDTNTTIIFYNCNIESASIVDENDRKMIQISTEPNPQIKNFNIL